MDIGKRIRQLRIRNGLTQQELASRCELTKGFVSQLENNLTTIDDSARILSDSPTSVWLPETSAQTTSPSGRPVH